MAFDGKIDGNFTIAKGQGFSQALAEELGLNAQQCKKLGSVWFEIFKEVGKDGIDVNNVHKDQKFDISAYMGLILEKVNQKLKTNIQLTPTTPPSAEEIIDNDNFQKKVKTYKEQLKNPIQGKTSADVLKNITDKQLLANLLNDTEVINIIKENIPLNELKEIVGNLNKLLVTDNMTFDDCIRVIQDFASNNPPTPAITDEQRAERTRLDNEARLQKEAEGRETARNNNIETLTKQVTVKVADSPEFKKSKKIEEEAHSLIIEMRKVQDDPNKKVNFARNELLKQSTDVLAYICKTNQTLIDSFLNELGVHEREQLMKKFDPDFKKTKNDQVNSTAVRIKGIEFYEANKAIVDNKTEQKNEAQNLSNEMAKFVAELVNPADPSKIKTRAANDGEVIIYNQDDPSKAVIITANGLDYTNAMLSDKGEIWTTTILASFDKQQIKFNLDVNNNELNASSAEFEVANNLDNNSKSQTTMMRNVLYEKYVQKQ